MSRRKVPLVNKGVYHICSKSIQGFKIFNSDNDSKRMLDLMRFYNTNQPVCKFSDFLEFASKAKKLEELVADHSMKLVRLIAYCIMPTHIHFILQQLEENGISMLMNTVLKAYSQYFNLRHNRKGPLWESRFKNVLVETDSQLLHLTRYIHLNPPTAHLVDRPEDWKWSSYREYLGRIYKNQTICDFSDLVDISIPSYQKFVNDRIAYQRELGKIKHLILE